MLTISGRFDGKVVVLDDLPPPELHPNDLVEVVRVGGTEPSRQELVTAFAESLRLRHAECDAATIPNSGRQWTREELYEDRTGR